MFFRTCIFICLLININTNADVNNPPVYGDWLVRTLPVKPKTLTPLISGDSYSSKVQSYILESLLIRDSSTLAWKGLLAKEWDISKNGLIITFALKEGIVFSDGLPLTASDIVFTYNFIMNEKINAPRQRAYLKLIKSVEAIDSHTIVFKYHKPFFQALALAGRIKILSEHYYAKYIKNPSGFNNSTGLLLGTGPYKLSSSTWNSSNNHIELIKNNRYWGGAPFINRLWWEIIAADSSRLISYRNGTVDTYNATPRVFDKLKVDKQIMYKSWTKAFMKPQQGYTYIAWNPLKNGESSIFTNKKIRQAMTYLTDRTKIVENIFHGHAEIAVSPFNPKSKQHDLTIVPYKYSLTKANKLLKESGYIDRNDDGIIDDESGKSFSFKLTYPQNNNDTSRMVLLLKDEYAKAGIQLIPDPQEFAVLVEMMNRKNYEALTLGWSGGGVETDVFLMFHSTQTMPNGDNFINYKNPDMDKLIDLARSTINEKRRMKLWNKVEKILHEDQPYTFLYRRKTLLFVDKRFKNLKMTKLGLNLDLVPLEIFVSKADQKYKH